MIYKTILTFWWQNNGTLEFRSQCHIFGWYIDIILTRCFRTIAIHLRHVLKTLEGDFKIQKENKKLYLGDSQMVNFLTRNPPVIQILSGDLSPIRLFTPKISTRCGHSTRKIISASRRIFLLFHVSFGCNTSIVYPSKSTPDVVIQ